MKTTDLEIQQTVASRINYARAALEKSVTRDGEVVGGT